MNKRLYDDNLYRFNDPQPSYWEATATDIDVPAAPLTTDDSCDVAIIGGGYTGLSAALHLARDHQVDVRVLEAGHIGWGASGRNGGFCCIGGTGTGSANLIKLVGLENAKEYSRSQVDAVNLVRSIGQEEDIDLQSYGAAELQVAHNERSFKRMREDHEILTNQLDLESEIVSAGAFRERYYDCSELFGAMISKPAFGLHPLRYCRGLAIAAARHGARLHDKSEVIEWNKGDDGYHRLVTSGAELRARKVILASNGFTNEILRSEFQSRTLPIISAIVVTRPLSDDERAAQRWTTEHPAINSRRIMNYFRVLPDKRFLFGGRGRSTGHPQAERATYRELASNLKKIWPAWSEVDVDYSWHGLICFTATLCPSIGQLEDDESVFFGYGYHGNGVNTATWTGKQLADWVGSGSPSQLPTIVRGLSRKFPLARMRYGYLQANIALAALLDRSGF